MLFGLIDYSSWYKDYKMYFKDEDSPIFIPKKHTKFGVKQSKRKSRKRKNKIKSKR